MSQFGQSLADTLEKLHAHFPFVIIPIVAVQTQLGQFRQLRADLEDTRS